MNGCRSWLGHAFVAHPVGYHFCRRCGESPLHEMVETEADGLTDDEQQELGDLIRQTLATPWTKTDLEAVVGENRFSIEESQTATISAETLKVPAEVTEFNDGAEEDQPTGRPGKLDADTVRARLEKWLNIKQTTITAAHNDGIDLGASQPVLYNLKNGKTVSPATLEKVSAALDQLFIEDETPDGEVGPKLANVEELPNKFGDEIRQVPNWSPPARCAKTP